MSNDDLTTADAPSDGHDGDDASSGGLSRRRLLGGAAAGASALIVANSQIGRAAAATTTATRTRLPRNPAASGIDHVVVVMMENRSFDHYLGWVPGADGPRANRKYKDAANVAHPIWHLDSPTGSAYHDPNHSQVGGVAELNGGACDGWLVAPSNDLYSIGYYRPEDLDFYRGAAPYWTVCDRFFASILGPTYPNRFYMHAAQTDRITNTTTVSTLPTIWDSLANAGVDGKYYYSDIPMVALWGGKYGAISHPFSEFLTDCGAGTLPSVSYVDPRFLSLPSGAQCDDHPHADIRLGQSFLNQIYQAVTASPQWGTTLLVITYDEWGGFFDHVPPGTAPDANPDHVQRGFRIPTILIGPRVRRHNVDHRTYDHTSILKFIEWRWGLPTLTPRDAAANNIADGLLFLRPPNLEAPQWTVPTPEQLGLQGAQPAGSAPTTDHEAEWLDLVDMAAEHGFAMP